MIQSIQHFWQIYGEHWHYLGTNINGQSSLIDKVIESMTMMLNAYH